MGKEQIGGLRVLQSKALAQGAENVKRNAAGVHSFSKKDFVPITARNTIS
jgi:hypothetical protein